LKLITFRADIHTDKTKKKKTVLLVDVVVGRMIELTPDQNPHGAGPEYDAVRRADFVGLLQQSINITTLGQSCWIQLHRAKN
jgi:hypothetical protein